MIFRAHQVPLSDPATHPKHLQLVMDTIDRVPNAGEKGVYLKQQLQDKLIVHKRYIDQHGEDMPEIRNWKWTA